MWVAARGAAQHIPGKVHAQTKPGLQCRQQVALATADLEHALVRRHKRPKHLRQARVVGARPVVSGVETRRDVIPVSDPGRGVILLGNISAGGKAPTRHSISSSPGCSKSRAAGWLAYLRRS